MPLDKKTLVIKIRQLEEYIRDVKKLRRRPKSEFVSHSDTEALAEHHVQRACQAALDIANHIIAEKGFGQPTMYKDLGYILAKERIVSEDMAKKLEQVAKFRNRLVHEYATLDASTVYEIVTVRIDDLIEFARQIYAYLDAHA